MAKTSLRVKQSRTPKYPTRGYSRCRRCGRVGHIPGMTKSSW